MYKLQNQQTYYPAICGFNPLPSDNLELAGGSDGKESAYKAGYFMHCSMTEQLTHPSVDRHTVKILQFLYSLRF